MHATIVIVLLMSMSSFLVPCEGMNVIGKFFNENEVVKKLLNMVLGIVNKFVKNNISLPDLGTYVTKLKLNKVPRIFFSCPLKIDDVNGQQELQTCLRIEDIEVSCDLKPTPFMSKKPVQLAVKPFEFLLELAIYPKEGSKSTQDLKEEMLPETPVKGSQILGLDKMLYKEWGGFNITGSSYGTFIDLTTKIPIFKTEIMHIIMRQLRPFIRTFLYTKARLSFL